MHNPFQRSFIKDWLNWATCCLQFDLLAKIIIFICIFLFWRLCCCIIMDSGDDRLSTRIQLTVLVLLCCQNAGHALLTRYSRVSFWINLVIVSDVYDYYAFKNTLRSYNLFMFFPYVIGCFAWKLFKYRSCFSWWSF